MTRRTFGYVAVLGPSAAFRVSAAPQSAETRAHFPLVEGLTRQVADFIVKTSYADLPSDVIEVGKKSILDGLGLALSGTVAGTGEISRKYLLSLGLPRTGAMVIGSNMKAQPRF